MRRGQWLAGQVAGDSSATRAGRTTRAVLKAGTAFEVAGTGVAGTARAASTKERTAAKGNLCRYGGGVCGARPSRATAAAGYLAAAASADWYHSTSLRMPSGKGVWGS